MAQVTYTIPDEKWPAFLNAFLTAFPKPPVEPFASMTDAQWVKTWGRLQFQRAYAQGVRKLAAQAASVDEEVIG